jgi:competence protein ComEA
MAISGRKNHRPATILLQAILAAVLILLPAGCGGQPTEIILTQTSITLPAMQVYIGGAVNNPGIYPLLPDDDLDSLIQAAGGLASAEADRIELYIQTPGEADTPQKIDINRAPAWLLEALPGIGEVTAQAIVDYRQQNGLFRNTEDLLKVQGIGQATLDKIAEYITVSDRD